MTTIKTLTRSMSSAFFTAAVCLSLAASIAATGTTSSRASTGGRQDQAQALHENGKRSQIPRS